MKNIRKHLDLAVTGLTVLYLSLEIINVALDLFSKVVNYAISLRKFSLLVQEER